MGFFDNFGSGFFSGLGNTLMSKEVMAAAIPTALSLLAGLTKSDPEAPYSNTQEATEANIAAQQQMLTQKLEAEREMAAMAVEAQLQSAKMAAATNLAGIDSRNIADSIALKIAGKQGNPALRGSMVENIAQGRRSLGQTAQAGYSSAAGLLGRFARG